MGVSLSVQAADESAWRDPRSLDGLIKHLEVWLHVKTDLTCRVANPAGVVG
ncbi:hypothetical protein N5A93_16860 [Roseovarius sp. EGI FJ00037]|uniref:DUF6647 family protein n=1 Tax=Roseovarius TaxID=74030 RepID=UPI0022BC5C0F|nr:hypothetical protein [Roseovarius sp. EGI FJ00037]